MRYRFIAPAASAAALVLAIPASAAQPSPGAPGAGDPYYPEAGNGGYHVSHYDLRLKYQPKTDRLAGTATLLATTTQELSRFNLDFALGVSEVRVNGKKARFQKSGAHELEVTPATPLGKRERATVVVRYAGTPSRVKVNGASNWLRTKDGGIAANEPESAWWWFPSNDHPTDKATFDVNVAVPDGTQALSNGTLQSQKSQAGWTRYAWRSGKPQATYLATLAAGKFDLSKGRTPSGVPVINAYSKSLGKNGDAARASVERSSEITGWLERYFGRYPFDALGGYVPDTKTGYALETQTRPYYSPKMFMDGSNSSVVVHELAHQWYGDSVSLHGWKDIWLNEGFAAYSEWLWSEDNGEGTAQQLADYTYASHSAKDPFWKVKPGDPGAKNQFHEAVYDRGALAVHALRRQLGDRDFFRVLKGWPARHAGGNATVGDFRKYAEQVSGKDLGKLFHTWLYQPSKPSHGAGPAPKSAPQQPRSWPDIQATRHGGDGHQH